MKNISCFNVLIEGKLCLLGNFKPLKVIKMITQKLNSPSVILIYLHHLRLICSIFIYFLKLFVHILKKKTFAEISSKIFHCKYEEKLYSFRSPQQYFVQNVT